MQRADAARMYGTDTTRATIHEFIDFACSTCRAFYLQRSDSLRTKYVESGEVNLVVHTFVIPRLMRGYHAAEAAYCAGALAGRDGFEGMQRRLFTDQADWRAMRDPVPGFVAYAEELGLPALLEQPDCTMEYAIQLLDNIDEFYGSNRLRVYLAAGQKAITDARAPRLLTSQLTRAIAPIRI